MAREVWKKATIKGKQVTYTCHAQTAKLVDITARIDGEENFHIHLDIPAPITREQVETRFAAELEND
jgi:hypothetical protein